MRAPVAISFNNIAEAPGTDRSHEGLNHLPHIKNPSRKGFFFALYISDGIRGHCHVTLLQSGLGKGNAEINKSIRWFVRL